MPLDEKTFTRMAAKAVQAGRENCVTVRCINRDLAASLSQQGSVVNVRVPGNIPARDVVPGPVPPGSAEPTSTFVPVTLTNFKEAPFTVTDQDLSGLDDPQSFISMQLKEAGRTIANAVDSSVLDLYRLTPFTAGVAGTTPFAASTLALQQAERNLITNLAPSGERKLILDPFAHTNALGLPGFQNAQAFGGNDVIREGRITRALGYDWAFNQNMKTHTKGVSTGVPLVNGAQAAQVTNLSTKGWTASVANILRRGDVINLAGDANPYVVTADVNSDAAGNAIVPVSNGIVARALPGLRQASADNTAISVVNSHQVSLALHPNFAVFASRVAEDIYGLKDKYPGYRMVWNDPVSGLAYLIKCTVQHYQTEFTIALLWGVRELLPQYGVRVMG